MTRSVCLSCNKMITGRWLLDLCHLLAMNRKWAALLCYAAFPSGAGVNPVRVAGWSRVHHQVIMALGSGQTLLRKCFETGLSTPSTIKRIVMWINHRRVLVIETTKWTSKNIMLQEMYDKWSNFWAFAIYHHGPCCTSHIKSSDLWLWWDCRLPCKLWT